MKTSDLYRQCHEAGQRRKVEIEKPKKPTVIVPEDQLSIAIGKSGQNVRLAGKLTGYELDVEAEKSAAAVRQKLQSLRRQNSRRLKEVESKPVPTETQEEIRAGVILLEAIEEHGTEEEKAKKINLH